MSKQIKIEKIVVTVGIILAMVIECVVYQRQFVGSLESTLFLIALLFYQCRFLYLNWGAKRSRLTFQASSTQKNPIVMDYTLNFLFFIIFPLGYTFLHYTFYAKWSMGVSAQIVFFALYLIGTTITLVSEHQRDKVKKEHPGTNFRLTGLFRYAICINYFGETLALPSLFYLSTGSIVIFVVMLLQQILDFIFVQIPKQEAYIRKNYPEDAEKILSQKKLIPFIY